ncbi:Lipoprotein-anchoring transpeptidase ErfK/SrfK [Cohaesibacter sp. ES.047]|uniref:L,D-transpeptidase n=1 Tax=Cohaesibacter sp. ES.047 TaxID=1798205 RepID=UPI000BB98B5B|nr:L,D-transpeptidase [Cohaesibacter sp. ES.047]SNY92083.1 Lipoprotein-anchoring transpeptidase ErfK/SrfK [Cohaesibacter sp. ES.047]
MKRLLFCLCTSALVTTGSYVAPAGASSLRYAPPPPVMLKADQIQPWVMQLRPGTHRAVPRDARPRVDFSRLAPAPNQGRTHAASAKQRKQRVRGIDPRFLPTVVDYAGPHRAGTVIVNTNERYLYLVEPDGTARRYGVGVGRPGFSWAGTHKVTRKAEWPSWRPPAEMRARQPGLPAYMEGGPRNPLGARALYLGSTLYRIHGSNEPWSIGHAVSSGCIRMRNEDVMDLYQRVGVGTKVVVI